jgi:hypothetical protein
MQRMRAWGLAAMFTVGTLGAAEEPFTRALPPGEFTAAGLEKLTAAERARLDALVRDYKSGALEKAKREAAAAEARAAQAEAKAAAAAATAQVQAKAQAEKAKAAEGDGDKSLLARAKVLLTPGTKIEYTTVEGRIAGEFRGWDSRTIFTLESGQRWQVSGTEAYSTPAVKSPAVKIVPGMMGTFFMTIEGVRPRVRVLPLNTGN